MQLASLTKLIIYLFKRELEGNRLERLVVICFFVDRSIEDVHKGTLAAVGGREAQGARSAVRAAQLERHRREAPWKIR